MTGVSIDKVPLLEEVNFYRQEIHSNADLFCKPRECVQLFRNMFASTAAQLLVFFFISNRIYHKIRNVYIT